MWLIFYTDFTSLFCEKKEELNLLFGDNNNQTRKIETAYVYFIQLYSLEFQQGKYEIKRALHKRLYTFTQYNMYIAYV